MKDLVQAKTRLAGLLSPSERRALAQAMLEDVLAALAANPEIDLVTLLSDDPCAHLLAAQYGAAHWPESELGCRGLNAVLGTACDRLLAVRQGPLLLLHADLPLLSGVDISAALAAHRESGGLVVGCDRHGTGTNLLCFDRASAPSFCFGTDSCARHQAIARAMGFRTTVLHRVGIGLDVDEPQDLAVLLGQLDTSATGHTAALVRAGGLAARVSMTLGSLALPEITPDRKEVH